MTIPLINDAWFVLGAVALAISALTFTRISADVILMGALTLLLGAGVITPFDALSGFSNDGVATVGALYIVVAGLRETGVVTWISNIILGARNTTARAQLRLMLPVAMLSAFVNNTPVVAMLIPGVRDWGRSHGISASKLLMPLSYAAIVGGTCTLIGTSTNLVVSGMMHQLTDVNFGLFDIAIIGIPCTIVVVIYTLFASRWLLPDHQESASDEDGVKQYLVEMLIEPGSPLANKSIEQAGLRHLPGLYLVSINRDDTLIAVVSPQEVLREGDHLLFAGMVDSVADLQRFEGLRVANDHVFKLTSQRPYNQLVELVVAEACPLVGKSIREGRFRNVYNAAILAVLRNGQHVHDKIGDIVLEAGDMLLVEAHRDFAQQHRNSKDFMLVSQVENSSPPNTRKRPLALAIFIGMIFVTTTGLYPLVISALLAAGGMILTRCTSAGNARREVSWQILIVMGASIGLGNALLVSGAADILASLLDQFAHEDPYIILGLTFLLTALLTAVISNIAAATLVFPIIVALSHMTGVSLPALSATIMVAASASFATPIGYQTNLMVYGPGGYRFSDFVKMGVPLTLLVGLVTVVLAEAFF